MKFERLDVLLIKKEIFSSRERAKEHIKNGEIQVDGKVIKKSAAKVSEESEVLFTGQHLKYVSRGGLKLERAIDRFNIELQGLICMDIGASTGGFTDCMIQNGAEKIFAIDVGTDQLHDSLRSVDKVISMENCNIRYLTENDIKDPIDFISIDVSFISLHKVIPLTYKFLKDHGAICALIKPQFECERKFLNKKGVIKNKKQHVKIVEDIIQLFKNNRYGNIKLEYSPIKGPNGNREYLIFAEKDNFIYEELDVSGIVESAHSETEKVSE